MEPGLYKNGIMLSSWEELLEKKIINIDDNKTFTTNYIADEEENNYEKIYDFIRTMTPEQRLDFKKYCTEVFYETPNFDTIESISHYDFAGVNISRPFLTGLLVFPEDESIEKLGYAALCDLSDLNDVKLPENLKEIGISCFASSGIQTLNIPPKIKEIKQFIFFNTKMHYIKIPDDAKVIYKEAFKKCIVKNIIYKNKKYDSLDDFLNSNKKSEKTLDDIINENTDFKKINKAFKKLGDFEIAEIEM